MKKYKIIIIGGGLAGLGCAKKLYEAGQEFKLITENIGGRVMTSPDGKVNYGAYYITQDCKNIKPYIDNLNPIRIKDFYFHKKGKPYSFFSPKIIKYLPAILKLSLDLLIFRRHFNALRKKAINSSSKKLIEKDPLLRKYYHQKADEYIKKRGLENGDITICALP